MIFPETMYTSVRQEILDQKKCQFNLFGASITLTAAVLAYGAATSVGPLVYVAPILLNVLATMMILDKAISIQRMVGYLQLMETRHNEFTWRWEYHLSLFRRIPGKSLGLEGFRRHSYVITVASVLFVINSLCAALYFYGPAAIMLRSSETWTVVSEFYGGVNVLVIALLSCGLFITLYRWSQLMFGKFTGVAVEQRWVKAIEESEGNRD